MGGVISSIFGGTQSGAGSVEVPAIPARENTADPESKAVRNEEQRKLKARRGMAGTILTSPLGTTGQSSAPNGILGRSL